MHHLRWMRWPLALMVLAACEFPSPSEQYACEITADCESGRVCQSGYCVIGQGVDGADANTTSGDASTIADALPPDADPFVMIAMQCVAAGYTLDAATGGYYRIPNGSASWTNAATDCADDVVGATHLIVLSTATEGTFMSSQRGWVGLSDRATEGTFVNVTGETPDYRPWESGQPDNGSGSEDCAQMKAGGGLDDDQCNNSHRYVCECDGRAPTP